jgi:hypothetical protein
MVVNATYRKDESMKLGDRVRNYETKKMGRVVMILGSRVTVQIKKGVYEDWPRCKCDYVN